MDRPQEGDRELNLSPPPAMCLSTGSPHRYSALPWGPQQETGSKREVLVASPQAPPPKVTGPLFTATLVPRWM